MDRFFFSLVNELDYFHICNNSIHFSSFSFCKRFVFVTCVKLGRAIFFPELVCWCFYFEARKKSRKRSLLPVSRYCRPVFYCWPVILCNPLLVLAEEHTHTHARTRTLPATHANLGRLSPAVEDARSDRGDARDIARESARFPPDAERSDQPAMREQLRK